MTQDQPHRTLVVGQIQIGYLCGEPHETGASAAAVCSAGVTLSA
jgi:hypothetical protein